MEQGQERDYHRRVTWALTTDREAGQRSLGESQLAGRPTAAPGDLRVGGFTKCIWMNTNQHQNLPRVVELQLGHHRTIYIEGCPTATVMCACKYI